MSFINFKKKCSQVGTTEEAIANAEFEEWHQPLIDMFPNLKKDKMGISLFVQPPGHTMFTHVDTYSSFIRRTGDEKPNYTCLLYTSPSPRDGLLSRMPSSA